MNPYFHPVSATCRPVMDRGGCHTDAASARHLKGLPPVRNATPRMAGPAETPPAPYLTAVAPLRR